MHHIYCEVEGVETITPCFEDAKRTFRGMIRDYPFEVVNWDTFEGLENSTMEDIANGVYTGRRVRVMQSDPN